MSQAAGGNFGSSEPPGSPAPNNRSSGEPIASGLGSTSLARKDTGPRTQQGKERSKQNAVKHGIFSKVAVVNGESRADFDALLNGLRNDLQPVGTLEELLVEKLATLFWRNRRLLIAEGAEIRAGSELVDWDGQERQRQEFAGLPPRLLFNSGLMLCIANPHAVQGCLSFLEELEHGIEARGFAPELDAVILTKLYGRDHQENGKPTLFGSYLRCAELATCPEEGRKEKGLPSNQKVKEIFLTEMRKVVVTVFLSIDGIMQ
jgi:hypothetical protein